MAARKAQNTNRQGANFELQIMHDLDRYGYTTMRSSGSRGAVDVVAVGDSHTLWIQAKISQPVIPPKERDAVWDLATRAGGLPVVAYRIGGSVAYRELTGTGPKEFEVFYPALSNRAPCGVCGHRRGLHVQKKFECVSKSDAIVEDGWCICYGFELMSVKR